MELDDIRILAIELEEWALKGGKKGGWKKIVPLITEHHYGGLLESLTDITSLAEYARRLHNNTQIIQRAFRNDTPNYRRQAAELAPAIRAAMDAEQKKQEEENIRAAIVTRECAEAVCSSLMRKPEAVTDRECEEAAVAITTLMTREALKKLIRALAVRAGFSIQPVQRVA